MINLWVRADLHSPSPETQALLPPERHEEYATIITEVGAAALALQDAYLRHTAALAARAAFFREVI